LDSKQKNKKRKAWKILLIIFCIMVPVAAWLIFAEQGLIKLYHTEMERQAYIERIRQLAEENQAMVDEIKRLRTDMKYVESVIRSHFNMIKKNEVIYRFSQEDKLTNGAYALPTKAQRTDNIEKSEGEDSHGKK